MSLADWFTPSSAPYRDYQAPMFNVSSAPVKTIYDIRLECLSKVNRADYVTEPDYLAAVERMSQFVLTGKHSDETGG